MKRGVSNPVRAVRKLGGGGGSAQPHNKRRMYPANEGHNVSREEQVGNPRLTRASSVVSSSPGKIIL